MDRGRSHGHQGSNGGPAAQLRGAGARPDQVPGRADRAPDEQTIGIGFPREERAAALAAEPDKFPPPRPSEERFRWIGVRLAALEFDELRELILDAWAMCVPKKVRREYFGES